MHFEVFILAHRPFLGPLNGYSALILKWLQLIVTLWKFEDMKYVDMKDT